MSNDPRIIAQAQYLGAYDATLQMWRGECGHHWLNAESEACPLCKLSAVSQQLERWNGGDAEPDEILQEIEDAVNPAQVATVGEERGLLPRCSVCGAAPGVECGCY